MEILATQLADLLSAVQRSDEKQVRRLLATNVSPDQQNTQGTTALMAATQIGNSKIIKMLNRAMQEKRLSGPLFFSQIVPPFPTAVTPTEAITTLVSADFTTRRPVTPPACSETIVRLTDVMPSPAMSPGFLNDLSGLNNSSLNNSISNNFSLNNSSLNNTTTVSIGGPQRFYQGNAVEPVVVYGVLSEDVAESLAPAAVLEPAEDITEALAAAEVPEAAKVPAAQLPTHQSSEAQIELLKTAICANDLAAVKALLSAAGTIQSKNWYDTPLLVIAAQNANGDIVKALLKAGANVNRGYDRLPLNVASERGNFEIVHTLMSAGAYLEAQEENGCTPLMCAAAAGHLLIVQMLVACGADVSVNYYGKTPLTLAAINGHRKIYDFLYPYTQQQQPHAEGTFQHQVALAAQHSRLEREMFSLFEPDVESASPQ